jgi:hypothetical protein
MRGSRHGHDFVTYEVTAQGAIVGGPLRNYRGILTGIPVLQPNFVREGHEGLTELESITLDTLVRLGEATHEHLAEHVSASPAALAATLSRLELLGYLRVTQQNGRVILHAIAQVGD